MAITEPPPMPPEVQQEAHRDEAIEEESAATKRKYTVMAQSRMTPAVAARCRRVETA